MRLQALLELQTGQVSFLSGLLGGFSVTVAANVLQVGSDRPVRSLCLFLLLLSTLLFLIALYVDVRLTIEVATLTASEISSETAQLIEKIRFIGTTSATLALICFIIAVGMLGFLASTLTGIFSSLLAIGGLALFAYIWNTMLLIS